MEQSRTVALLLAGVVLATAAAIVITSGESIAVRYLTSLVALDVATRLVLHSRRRTPSP
jgi:hypothetical protein